MLPREVRCCFFQERVFHLELAVPPLQLSYPFLVGHIRRKRISGMLLPVILHPEPERGIVNVEFSRHLGDRQRVIDHLPGGLLLKLRSVSLPFSWHSFPSLSRRILLDPLSGNGGAPHSHPMPRFLRYMRPRPIPRLTSLQHSNDCLMTLRQS